MGNNFESTVMLIGRGQTLSVATAESCNIKTATMARANINRMSLIIYIQRLNKYGLVWVYY